MDFKKFILLNLFILLISITITGCGFVKVVSATIKKDGDTKDMTTIETMVTIAPPTIDTQANIGAKKFALMALFSKLSYSEYLNKKPDRDNCNEVRKKNILSAINPAEKINNEVNPSAKWRLWEDDMGCFDANGLYFEVYVYGAPNEVIDAVIAIRGSESELNDWWNNLSVGILGVDPKQYVLARDKIPTVIHKLMSEKNKPNIYLTGHSLGGGIAQQISYMEPAENITETIVFNTSPVTNWSTLRHKRGLIKNPDPKIIRVTEKGEILSYARWVSSRVSTVHFNRYDYEFYFKVAKKPIKSRIRNSGEAHRLDILNCNFALRSLEGGADLHFSPEMADNVLNIVNDGGKDFCPKETFDEEWKSSYKKTKF